MTDETIDVFQEADSISRANGGAVAEVLRKRERAPIARRELARADIRGGD